MKKRAVFSIILLVCLLFSACTKEDDNGYFEASYTRTLEIQGGTETIEFKKNGTVTFHSSIPMTGDYEMIEENTYDVIMGQNIKYTAFKEEDKITLKQQYSNGKLVEGADMVYHLDE